MTPKQEEALRDYLQEVITPLIEQVLVKKLGQAMTFAKQELIQPKREWVGLTNEEITDLYHNENLGQQSAVAQAMALLKERNT